MLKKAEDSGRIKGLVVGQGAPELSHQFFANDIIVLTKANEREVYELMNIPNDFSLASSQRINVAKSGLIFGKNISRLAKVQLSRILNMQEWENPGKYLRNPAQ